MTPAARGPGASGTPIGTGHVRLASLAIRSILPTARPQSPHTGERRTGYLFALVLLPILSADAEWGDARLIAPAIFVATAVALFSRRVGKGSSLRFVGAGLVVASAILIGVTPVGVIGTPTL